MIVKNEGKLDRVIRLIVGAGLAYAAYANSGVAAIILGVAAAAAVLTGLVGFCGLYALLGLSTCGVKKP